LQFALPQSRRSFQSVEAAKFASQLFQSTISSGRAIAQAVSSRLPTAAARVRAQVRKFEICDLQSGTGAGFLRLLRFPLPIVIPPTAPHSSSSGVGTIGQLLADIPSELSLNPSQETKEKRSVLHNFLLPSILYNNIVTCQPFVGLRNGAWLGSRPVNKSSAQPR
jgi:hypothetical protein